MMYYAAISNIKKYPLPIVCEAQLKSISGIGDYLCGQLLSVIKRQYKHFANQ